MRPFGAISDPIDSTMSLARVSPGGPARTCRTDLAYSLKVHPDERRDKRGLSRIAHFNFQRTHRTPAPAEVLAINFQ
jgi:hypothetical protein